MSVTLAHATHDLNGVRVLRISGWGNDNYVIQPVDNEQWVHLWAPRLVEGEEWTFPRVDKDGVLNPFSDLIGSPGLIASRPPAGAPLVIQLPRHRVDEIKVIVE